MPIEYHTALSLNVYARINASTNEFVQMLTANGTNGQQYLATDAEILATSLPAGVYSYTIREGLANDPEIYDNILGQGMLRWNGSAEVDEYGNILDAIDEVETPQNVKIEINNCDA
jgi:hypothetical protein